MAAKHKTSTAELIAIYRLEFYKKQKNWKFCHDVCKKEPEPEPEPEPAPAKDPKSEFNKTYKIDAEPDAETASPLNHAFLETDVDKFPPSTSPDLDTDRVWPEHFIEQHYETPPEDQDSRHEVWREPGRPWTEWAPRQAWRPEAAMETMWGNKPQKVLLEGGQEFYDQDCNANSVGVDWQARTHAWEMRAADAEATDEGEVSAAAADELLRAADRWLCAGKATHDEASLESFMQGAAAAPHSSELDLRTRTTGSDCDLSLSSVSSLSGQQLTQCLGRHATALRRLLGEAKARGQLGHSQSLDEPTRDPGPCAPPPPPPPLHRPPPPLYCFPPPLNRPPPPLHRPPHPLQRQDTFVPPPPIQRQETFVKEPIVKDSFVAGSFTVSPESVPGRGRGRLRVRPGVIGIGMGRPYRL